MIKHSLLFTLIIFQFINSGCVRKSSVNSGQICQDNIQRAEKLQKQQENELGANLNETIANLIIAAKIHAQHSEQVKCIEKTERALDLLKDPDAAKDLKN